MSEAKTVLEVNTQLSEPPMFKVIYMNDNETSMQFVIDSLMNHFGYAMVAAARIADEVHEEGSASVAVLPYEYAEQKGTEVVMDARRHGYPLQVRLEKALG